MEPRSHLIWISVMRMHNGQSFAVKRPLGPFTEDQKEFIVDEIHKLCEEYGFDKRVLRANMQSIMSREGAKLLIPLQGGDHRLFLLRLLNGSSDPHYTSVMKVDDNIYPIVMLYSVHYRALPAGFSFTAPDTIESAVRSRYMDGAGHLGLPVTSSIVSFNEKRNAELNADCVLGSAEARRRECWRFTLRFADGIVVGAFRQSHAHPIELVVLDAMEVTPRSRRAIPF